METRVRCPNMNHGRLNSPVRYCPTCGDSLNLAAAGRCSDSAHAVMRRDRHAFCYQCGKKLKVA